MNKYQSYKSSGVEWIGEIPEHWSLKRICYVFKPVSIKNNTGEVNLSVYRDYGVIPTDSRDDNHNTISEDISNYKLVQIGDFVMNKMKCWMGSLGLSEYRGIVSPSYTVMRPITKENPKYLHYLLRSQLYIPQYRKLSYGVRIGQWDMRFEDFRELPCLLPKLQEQLHIVQFLDEKTGLIDKLISTKERKITLLKEQRTSLINQVVTKGLNPNVKMKDSGVEWIGEIPEDWMISKFKFDTSTPVQYGLNISGDKYQEEGIRFIRITDLTEEGELIKEDGKYLDENEVPSEFFLNKWDVLFCRSGHTVGKSYLHKEDGKFTSGGYLVRFNFRNYFESKFIFYISKTSFYWDWIKLNSVVSTIENVNGDKYQNFQYPKPPIQEQQTTVEHLDSKTKEIDDLVHLEQKKIDLLKEYRQSLISEVVTGKIKVTN